MKKIELYKKVRVNKDVQTKSIPSIFVPKGTIGHILEIYDNHEKGYDYLLEMVIDGEEVVECLHQDEIEEA